MDRTSAEWAPGVDPAGLSRVLRSAHATFRETGRAPTRLRPIIAESWQRSAGSGVDPDGAPPLPTGADDDLHTYRDAHPMAQVMPVVRRLLVTDAAANDMLVAVGDAQGRLLWVEGDRTLRARAEAMSFVEGARWAESDAGTNAPGTAVAVDAPIQIFAAEHYSAAVHPWSCSAAPVHDPATGQLLGVIDVTGGDHVAAPQMLTLVRAAATAAESDLLVRRADRPTPPAAHGPEPDDLSLHTFGDAGGVLRRGTMRVPLSLRLLESLLVLTTTPEGLTTDGLAAAVYESPPSAVTVRAEMTRLRRALGDDVLASRPYRLRTPVRTDIDELRRLLDMGAYYRALALYRGPVLAASTAPAVLELREEVATTVRDALLSDADAELLAEFARAHADDDVEVWETIR